MRRSLVTLPCAPSPAGQVNGSIKLSTHYRPSSGSTPALRTFQDHGSPSAMRSASLSQDKCGLPVTQIPEREPPSRTAICALDEVLPNLWSAHVKVVGLLLTGLPLASHSSHANIHPICLRLSREPPSTITFNPSRSRLPWGVCQKCFELLPRLGGGFIVLGGLAGVCYKQPKKTQGARHSRGWCIGATLNFW
ncbi:hypothetical protein DFH07DRAFT_776105 [Mycena maculata]|uniref:Uncharacterized protein n=1 Tax=Mycena maculata TaxID=230809 RepID=A0AAD7IR72_9AGAR|nr:hypothetical protein DFH07DRAFT_776105 [Mycena maculata]